MPADPTLRVLLAVPETTGGIGQHARMLALGLRAHGVAVTVCGPLRTLERLALPPEVAVVAAQVGTARAWPSLRSGLRDLAAAHDVTHAHGVRAGAQLALSGVRPLVTTWHNAPLGSPTRRAVHRLLERVSARRSAVVLAASDDLVARARAAGAGSARLCAVAAPTGRAAPPPAARPLHDPPTVLAVARLHPQKRLDLLIRAAAGWPATPDRPRVLVAGDGPLAESLRAQAHQLAAPVTFLGARDDIDDLLARADVVVLSSDWEARPLVAQEALRAGVPLVATDVGGVRGLVGEAALLVPPRDVGALSAAILRVVHDESLRRGLVQAGPTRAATWPTVEEMVNGILSVYLEVRSRVS